MATWVRARQMAGVGHDDAQMTIDPASAWGADLASVGVKLLLEESQGRVGGFTKVGCGFRGAERSSCWSSRGGGHHCRRQKRKKGLKKAMLPAAVAVSKENQRLAA
jgi:hypothetical protein